MTVRKRVGAMIATMALVATPGLASTAEAATSTGAISAGLTQVNLLNFNDFHGRVDARTGPNFACTIQTQRAALGADSTLLLSAGDNIGASLFVSFAQQDIPTLDYLNALGLDAAAVGNHEFDKGYADLTGRVDAAAEFPYLGANVYQRGTATPALQEYEVKTVNGVRVGIVGAVTQETPSLVSPDGIQAIDFGDPIAAINRVAAQLSDGNEANGEADVVVAEIHDGAGALNADKTPIPNTIYQRMVSELSAQVDVVFNGHTHLTYTVDADTGVGTRNISQAGSYGGGLTQVQLGIDPVSKQVVEYVNDFVMTTAPTTACSTDPTYLAAKEIVDAAVAQAKVIGAQPIGTVTADITTAFQDATPVDGQYTGTTRDDRLRESTLGNLVAQAWYEELNVPGRPGADIGLINPGSMRSELFYASSAAGEGDGVVTLEEASSVNPFANTLVVKDLTGAQLKTLLEQQWQPDQSRAFLNLGLSDNVAYTFDPYRDLGDRITSIRIDGENYDPAATYTVASSSFLMAGGDNFFILQEGTNTRDTGLIDTEAFMNFLAREGTVSPDFAKRGVGVIDAPLVFKPNKATTVRVEGVDMTSLGSPVNTKFTAYLGGKEIGTAEIVTERIPTPLPVRDGTSDVVVTIQPKLLRAGMKNADHVLTLVAKESGTTVVLDIRVR